jgi:hypothetical protein
MDKISPRIGILLALFAFVLFSCVSGCGPDEGRDKGKAFNEDSVRNHIISADLARQYTRNFRASIDSFNRICSSFKDSMQFGHAEEFPADVFYAMLAEHNDKQGNATGIRIYYGRGPNGEIKLVLVPVDSLGNDIIGRIIDLNGKPAPGTAHTEALTADDGQTIEQGQRCPPVCTSTGGLNQ